MQIGGVPISNRVVLGALLSLYGVFSALLGAEMYKIGRKVKMLYDFQRSGKKGYDSWKDNGRKGKRRDRD